MKLLLSLCIFISLSGCFSDELPNYSREQLLNMGREGDPNLEVLVPASISESLVNCHEYTPSCRFGYRVIIKKIEMVALFYEKQDDALKAAKRVRGYVARNWVFDDVAGEPILERFVQKYFKAVKAESVTKK